MTGKHAVLGMAMAVVMYVPAFPAYAKLIKDSYWFPVENIRSYTVEF